jgi:hypothetical protein
MTNWVGATFMALIHLSGIDWEARTAWCLWLRRLLGGHPHFVKWDAESVAEGGLELFLAVAGEDRCQALETWEVGVPAVAAWTFQDSKAWHPKTVVLEGDAGPGCEVRSVV